MNRVVSWLHSIRLRQIITVFMVALIFTVSNAFQAQAEPVTPEAANYQIDRTDSQIRIGREKSQDTARINAKDTKQTTENVKKGTQDAGKNLIENVREKLNLD